MGLIEDGTVVAVGGNFSGQCNVSGWTGIQQVSAGGSYTVGLSEDGTVVAVGGNASGQCDIGGWTGIRQVSAGRFHTVGLRDDGTVLAAGDNTYGQCNVGDWALGTELLNAETLIMESCDILDGIITVPVSIDSIKDAAGGGVITGIHIKSYEATALYNPSGMEVLTVRPGELPFDSPLFDLNGPGGYSSFSQTAVDGCEPSVAVSRLVPRLTGCTLDSYELEVQFDSIADDQGRDIHENEPHFLTFQRGDVNGDGSVNIIDAMTGAQYIVGLRSIDDIRLLNMASVHHNGEDGDIMNIIDCMYIAQYVVGLRDCNFEIVSQ